MFIVKKEEKKTHQKRRGSQFGSSDISLQRGDHVKSFQNNQSNVATFVKRAKQREKEKKKPTFRSSDALASYFSLSHSRGNNLPLAINVKTFQIIKLCVK